MQSHAQIQQVEADCRIGRDVPGIDLYRGLAVVLMFLAHAWRMTRSRSSSHVFGAVDAALAWMDRGVAYVAASFLFISGFSLVLSYKKAMRCSPPRTRLAFMAGVLRRSGGLYFLAVLMFVAEHGTDLPDLLASPGILSVIAIASTLTAASMMSSEPKTTLAFLAVALIAVAYVLEATGSFVSGVNAGPGGAVPLAAFAPIGAIAASLHFLKGGRGLIWFTAMAIPLFIIAIVDADSWLVLHSSTYRNHEGLAIADYLRLVKPSEGSTSSVFWNPSTLGALGLVAPVLLTATALLTCQYALVKSIVLHTVTRPLFVLGRHALVAYLSHYVMLGIAELAGLRPTHGGWTILMVLGLVCACWLLCWAAGRARTARGRTR